METIAVAVGVLQRSDGRVLVAQRDQRRHQGGGLEFPGGKIEPAEPAHRALARELVEELGVRPTQMQPLIRLQHRYSDRAVELEVFLVRAWEGDPAGAEGQAIEWRQPGTLSPGEFPAANRSILAALCLPGHYLITPAPGGGSARARKRLVDGVHHAVAQGIALVQLRAHGLDAMAWHRLVADVADVADATDAARCRLLVNAPAAAVPDLPPRAGLHVGAAELRRLRQRPLAADRLFACSCHDPEELTAAAAVGADFAVLGPVLPTPSHPEAWGIGWERFAALVATTTLPVYALGGVAPDDLQRARAAGAVGVAGIRGFWPGG